MKVMLRLSTAILFALIFSTSVSFACSSDCCTLTGITTPVSAVSLFTDVIHNTQAGIVLTSHAGCAVVQETSNQVAAIPDALNLSLLHAEDATASVFENVRIVLRSAAVAVINFSSSLLRIVFSSFSAHA
ncbi:hypothetical protein KKC97_03300 [bacterium]|nr:hypothetical protein [bacterium]MBU1636672.1 hypothetical protein [bacterium]MBU1919744.1 hypothetical protein [bacterium]